MRQQRKSPIWLEPYWQVKRDATATRINAAIGSLQEKRIKVSLSAICEEVKTTTGSSVSPNSIKRNPDAYRAYLEARPQMHTRSAASTGLRSLAANLDSTHRAAMHARIARLRRECKDSLIARLIAIEQRGAEQELVERRLRDQIITLSLADNHGRDHLLRNQS